MYAAFQSIIKMSGTPAIRQMYRSFHHVSRKYLSRQICLLLTYLSVSDKYLCCGQNRPFQTIHPLHMRLITLQLRK